MVFFAMRLLFSELDMITMKDESLKLREDSRSEVLRNRRFVLKVLKLGKNVEGLTING